MLVLSRRTNESIVFPELGVTLRVLQVNGSTTRLGIEAPPAVRIVRSELLDRTTPISSASVRSSVTHTLCNRLNKISLGLHRIQQQWEAGQTEGARATLDEVAQVLETIDPEWVASQVESPPPPAGPRQFRALIVEDDANERELLAGMLRMHGCECDTVPDGCEAIDYLASHEKPDLVLLDMWLPRCNGAQTLEHIRRDPRQDGLKVFAISGTPPTDLGLSIGVGGVDAWFSKPLKPRLLWEAIQQSLASGSAAN